MNKMELVLSMDRLDCITRGFLEIIETKQFESVKLIITETDLNIIPIAPVRYIVLKK